MSTRLSRREFVKAGALAAAAGMAARSASAKSAKRPNILFVMTDQEPTTCSACYGNPLIKTPARDFIAQNGTRFNNHFTASYACSPSRATMMTGLYTHHHGVYQNGIPLKRDLPALGHHVSAAGYDTLWIGKSHLGGETSVRSPDNYRCNVLIEDHPVGVKWNSNVPGGWGEDAPTAGFSKCLGGWKHYREWLRDSDAPDFMKNDEYVGNHNGLPSGPDWTHAYSRLGPKYHMANFFTDSAIEYLDRMKQADKPFCLVLSYYGPHLPVAPPKPWDTIYALDDVTLPANFRADLSRKPIAQRTTHEPKGVKPWWTIEQFKDYIRRYSGYVSYLDGQLLRVLKRLTENRQDQDTIVLFTSDHGDLLGEFGMVLKSGNNGYDALMKVPFLICWPGHIEPGQVEDGVTSSVDLMPTLLDLAGLPVPEDIDGRSMKERILEKGAVPRSRVFTDAVNKCYMVREGDWKFVLNASSEYGRYHRDYDELYNMAEDPHEISNLAAAPEHKARAGAMRETVLNWLEETGHPYAEHIRRAAPMAPPVCEPFDVALTRFEDLGGGNFTFEYAWRCDDKLAPAAPAQDFAALAKGENARQEPLWTAQQPTTPARNEWALGKAYGNRFTGQAPGRAKPGAYTLYVGMELAKGQPRFSEGFLGERPVAKVLIEDAPNGMTLTAIPYSA